MLSGLRYKKFHTSYGVGAVCLGLLIGISLSQVYTASHTPLGWLVGLVFILACLIIRIRIFTFVPIFIISVVIGYLHSSNYDITLRRLESFSGKAVVMSGNIAEDPQATVRGDVRLVLNDIHVDGVYYEGSVWVTAEKENVKRGDNISLTGKMKPGFGTFQLSGSYITITQHNRTDDPLIAVRDRFAGALRNTIVEPAASLGIGFVIGQKSALPPELEDQLRVVGLTHLVVASGYNLTILMRFSKRIFEKHSKSFVVFSSLFLVISFIALSGASPSMVRAGLVAGLSILAWTYGRRFHPVLLILFVAAATATFQPIYLWADIGWWLSFLAFFGVLVCSPLLLNMIYKTSKVPAVSQLVSETLTAQIMTLPLILMVFGSLPILSIIANIVTAPLIPLAMLATATAGISSMILPALAPVLSLPAEILLSYIVFVVRTLSTPTWSLIDISISTATLGVIFTCYTFLLIIIWKKTKYNFRSQSIID